MPMKRKKVEVDWTSTPEGLQAYRAARDIAQARANESGYDHGLEGNDLFKTFSVRMLPNREHRCGHELRCEVVSCEILTKCRPGHGPGK